MLWKFYNLTTSDYGAEGDRETFALDRINPNMLTLRLGYHF